MKAITQDKYGSADVLRLRDIEAPTPGDREVLVRVQAAGIARGVLHVMTGEPYLMRLVGFGLLKPKHPVPGQDVAGTVAAIGDGVTRFDVGDEVFGIAKGSFAEYALAREDNLNHKPENLSFEEAAAMPISGLTALRALDAAGVTSRSNVLIADSRRARSAARSSSPPSKPTPPGMSKERRSPCIRHVCNALMPRVERSCRVEGALPEAPAGSRTDR